MATQVKEKLEFSSDSVKAIVMGVYDAFDSYTSQQDWVIAMSGFASNFPNDKEVIIGLIEKKTLEFREQHRASNQSTTKKRTRRSGFARGKNRKVSQVDADCETGDCSGEGKTVRGGLHKTSRKRMTNGVPTNKPAGSGPTEEMLKEMGVGFITNLETLRVHFAKKEESPDVYKTKIIEFYKMNYSSLTKEELTIDIIESLPKKKVTQLEKMYLELMPSANATAFNV